MMENKEPKQRVKCRGSRSRITSLALDDPKKEFMNDSQFSRLCNMSNGKESSATLVQALCEYYDGNADVFVFNNDASFTFCAKEVASVLSIEDSGRDLDLSKSTHDHVPPSVCELREKYCKSMGGPSSASTPLTTAELKLILQRIEVIDEDTRLSFQKLMSFYVVDQFLLPSTSHSGRNKYWKAVEDLESFERVNWAKLTCKHIKDGLTSLQSRLNDPNNAEKELFFGGCTPVLEAIIYARIPSLSPKKFTTHPPEIQMYQPQRKNIDQWHFSRLTSDQIRKCPFCCVQATAHDLGNGDGRIARARDLLQVTNMLAEDMDYLSTKSVELPSDDEEDQLSAQSVMDVDETPDHLSARSVIDAEATPDHLSAQSVVDLEAIPDQLPDQLSAQSVMDVEEAPNDEGIGSPHLLQESEGARSGNDNEANKILSKELTKSLIDKGISQEAAAEKLNVSLATLEHYREHHACGMWPSRITKKLNAELATGSKPTPTPLDSATITGTVHQEHAEHLRQDQICGHAGGFNVAKSVEAQEERTSILVVKAVYKEHLIRFDFLSTSSVAKLKEEVMKRLPLQGDRMMIKYQDEDKDWVILACSDDLHHCLHLSASSESKVIRLMIVDS